MQVSKTVYKETALSKSLPWLVGAVATKLPKAWQRTPPPSKVKTDKKYGELGTKKFKPYPESFDPFRSTREVSKELQSLLDAQKNDLEQIGKMQQDLKDLAVPDQSLQPWTSGTQTDFTTQKTPQKTDTFLDQLTQSISEISIPTQRLTPEQTKKTPQQPDIIDFPSPPGKTTRTPFLPLLSPKTKKKKKKGKKKGKGGWFERLWPVKDIDAVVWGPKKKNARKKKRTSSKKKKGKKQGIEAFADL